MVDRCTKTLNQPTTAWGEAEAVHAWNMNDERRKADGLRPTCFCRPIKRRRLDELGPCQHTIKIHARTHTRTLQATQNPAMFTDAMSMLGDPSAVKEAEAMMNDPEFKSEINQYMETLKNNSAFRDAMAEAQRKYQVRGGLLSHSRS